MTHHPEPPQNDPQDAPTGAVGVDMQEVISGYVAELSATTQRAILAEAGMRAVQAQLAEAHKTINALSPGAPDTQEG